MPEKRTLERARRDRRQGKASSTQAGEFVREEMDHIREGKHGARSAKQAIAIGLSKARRAGVALKPPKAGTTSEKTRRSAARDDAVGRRRGDKAVSKTRSQAATNALEHEGRAAASKPALAEQAHEAAAQRTASQRSLSAKTAARTRSSSKANTKAATTRAAPGRKATRHRATS